MLNALLASVLAAAAASAQPAAGNGSCAKDVFVYFDVSRSMYIEREGASAAQLVAEAVSGLLGREGFAGAGDRVRVATFAERVAIMTDTADVAAAAREIRTLADAATTTARSLDVGNTNRTDLAAILRDIRSNADEERHQIFIIASDFAHDPTKSECSQWRGRIATFRAAAADAEADLPQTPRRKMALLTARVQNDECDGREQEVATDVIAIFDEILGAKQVEITHSSNRIANRLRRAIAQPVAVRKGPPAVPPNDFALIAQNPNPFRVDVQKVTFRSLNGTVAAETDHIATLGCGAEQTIAARIPEPLRNQQNLSVALITTTPPADALELPRSSIVITPPELHVFDYFGTDTYAVQFIVEPFGSDDVTLTVSGIPGTDREQIYKLPTREKTRVALLAKGAGGGNKSRITVTLKNGALYVQEPGDAVGEPRPHAPARVPQSARADSTPTVVRRGAVVTLVLMGLSLLGFIPGKPTWWYHKYKAGRDLHDFLNALGLKMNTIGGTSLTTGMLWPYGRISDSASTETIVLSLAAAGAVLFALRWFAILVLWRWLFERDLVATKKAVRRRKVLSFVIVAISVAAGSWVYTSLTSALVNSVLISPEPSA